ncbi:tyrosine-type recombinase/integrase [Escherichia coli]|nr:tyrosine-type recombinase/integrase [Escherichia coli]EFI6397942.1 tyrosine-type recombinase/integrase [Escherichia coli]HAM4493089.1 tyrosine-type recombinase/integrase [Escherichia coli]
MPILDLRFSNKSIHQLPHPLTGCQEYRDIHCQNLRALVYPNRITLAFRATINNQRIYETLGQFPQLCVEDARQHVMKLLADKNRLAVQSRRFTVEQAINDLWLPDLQLYKKSPQSELSKLNLYVRPFWGKRQLRDITAGELEQYAAGLREKLRPSTVNRILAILSKICSLAVRAGWITHSPMSHVRYLKENNIRYRTLSATEIPRFIDAATALQTPAADSILLALYTGMRIGEVCTLKWEYWHLDMHQLILPDTKSGHPFTCPLAPPAIAVVQCQQDLMLSKTYIFPRLPGQTLSRSTLISTREMWLSESDLVSREQDIRLNLEFDFKRQPVQPAMNEGHLLMSSRPWDNMEEALQQRSLFDDWRQTHTLKTLADWDDWCDFLYCRTVFSDMKLKVGSKRSDDILVRLFLRALTQCQWGLMLKDKKSYSCKEVAEWLTSEGYSVTCQKAPAGSPGPEGRSNVSSPDEVQCIA